MMKNIVNWELMQPLLSQSINGRQPFVSLVCRLQDLFFDPLALQGLLHVRAENIFQGNFWFKVILDIDERTSSRLFRASITFFRCLQLAIRKSG